MPAEREANSGDSKRHRAYEWPMRADMKERISCNLHFVGGYNATPEELVELVFLMEAIFLTVLMKITLEKMKTHIVEKLNNELNH